MEMVTPKKNIFAYFLNKFKIPSSKGHKEKILANPLVQYCPTPISKKRREEPKDMLYSRYKYTYVAIKI